MGDWKIIGGRHGTIDTEPHPNPPEKVESPGLVAEWKARWNHQKKQREAAQTARNKALASVQALKSRIRALEAQVAGMGEDWSKFEDDLSDVIQDSIDMDWTSRAGAKAVVRWLSERGE